MHSHDRTLLAALGFADPDKKNPRHTLACQYIARPDVAARIWEKVGAPAWFQPCPDGVEFSADFQYGYVKGRGMVYQPSPDFPGQIVRELRHVGATHEAAIVKGDGKFRQVVGFWDVILTARVKRDDWSEIMERREFPSMEEGRRVFRQVWGDADVECHVEVKATRCDVADIARQLELYLEFTPSRAFRRRVAVVTTWSLPGEDRALLEQKGIRVVTLGAPFDEYCRARAEEKPPEDDGL